MNRTLLIARREYVAYAKTVGFWLSLLAFPLFAVLGGAIPLLIRSSEPVRVVTVIEQGPDASGLAAAVRAALQAEVDEQRTRIKEATEKDKAGGRALAALAAPKMRIVAPPPAIADNPPGPARDAAIAASRAGPGGLSAIAGGGATMRILGAARAARARPPALSFSVASLMRVLCSSTSA